MARRARRDDDEITVDELLRETGATARPLTGGSLPPRPPVPEAMSPEERIEQRAREAAAAQQRAGTRIRWASAICGAVVVLGSVVVILVTTTGSPGREASPALMPLLPATTPSPSVSAKAPPSPTPIPTVMAGRQTSTPAKTTTPTPSSAAAPPAPCSVRFTVQDQWDDGFTAAVTVTNKGGKAFSPWTLSWTFAAGQRVTHGWDGDYDQSGGRVTVTAAEWNTTLAPGATVTTGFNGSIRGGNPAPGAFTLNGAACDAG
ncbi:cellulose-binding domain-containing protein [Amycolatopsis sp. NPDC088138]|uniref:cellulose-binding domain-containing protein n=1 Tax=Amycolatopsis sp. NPDC088138 TaxID=3363938 RepID=UPI0037F1CBF4